MDGYICRNCDSVFHSYSRFCSTCGQEKTLELKPNLFLIRFAINAISITPMNILQKVGELSGLDCNDKFDLNQIIISLKKLS